ncbi:MAG TPA: glycosyltransferase [Candidatus Angelobacter sp.]|nr:glycosyltransferase [Candidatus Angelobacter sp.]
MNPSETLPVASCTLPAVDSSKPISVCLLISSLEFGGAERQVVEMVRSFDPRMVKPIICSLSPKVPLARFLPGNQEVLNIVEKRGRFDFTTVFRVARLLRRHRVEVVHAFLFDAEIIARLAAPLAGVPVVIASERNTDYVRPRLHTIALKSTGGLVDVMVANSMSGKRFNIRTLGLADSQIEVVHNGVDVERFRPDRASGIAFRERLGIAPETPLIGMVGSYKRQKAQDCFLRMAARIRQEAPGAHFMLVGEPLRDDFEETSRFQAEVQELAKTLKVADCCRFLGNQQDMKSVYNACNATALLSRREGTPNVVLESMACGVPVIATDVADNSLIIVNGKTGFVVPPEDHAAAAMHAIRFLRDPAMQREMSAVARTHACEQFSLRTAANKLEKIYARCLQSKRGGDGAVLKN